MWEKYGSWCYYFTLLDIIALHWLFHAGFREITFLKWSNVSNWNSWFLATLLNWLSRRFPFTQTNIYFLELKSILIWEKSIFHVSNLNIRKLDSPTEWPLTRIVIVIVLQPSNHKTNQKQLGKLKCNKNQKFHIAS